MGQLYDSTKAGKYGDGGYVAGKALDDRLDQIERFLTKHFLPPDGGGG